MLVHEGHTSARSFFTRSNAGSYDTVVRLATIGRDSMWKREITNAVGKSKSVLELACGTGVLSSMLTRSGRSVVGIDLTFEYLHVSKSNLQRPVAQGTAEVLPYRDESFDAIVSSYLAKYVDIQSVVEESWRVLRAGGVIVFHDFTYPSGVMRRLWNAYFAMLRIAGRVVMPWKTVFEQLDNVIKNSDWVRQTTNVLYSQGFQNVDCRYYTAGTAALVFAKKP